jgi:hypothetical protein
MTRFFVLAYLDPGSGSMLLQILLGGVAGVAVAGKMYWQRIKARFSSTKPASDAPPSGSQ